MYIGRFVVVGRTSSGLAYLGYRVSSRSFPNRKIVLKDDRALVVPTADAAPSDNPYVSYNCLRESARAIAVANGSHLDPVIEKTMAGYPLRDAMALALLALDYEHDQLNTPRIVAAIDRVSDGMYLAIVSDRVLSVQHVSVPIGQARLVATYERTEVTPIALSGETAEALCDALWDCEYTLPVAALTILCDGPKLLRATRSARQ